MLKTIANSEYAVLQLIIQGETGSGRERSSPRRGIWLFDLLRRYVSTRKIPVSDATATIDCEGLIGSVDRIRLQSTFESGDHETVSRCVNKIKQHRLDVIIALSAVANIEILRDLSKYGVWYYEHGAGTSRTRDHDSFGVLEVLKGQPFLRSALLADCRGAGTKGRILYESFSAVYDANLLKGRNEHFWKILTFVPRCLKHLWAGEDNAVHELGIMPESAVAETANPGRYIDNMSMALSLLRYVLRRTIRKLIRQFYVEKWILLYQIGNHKTIPSNYKRIMPPEDRFWADPHVAFRDDAYYIFFEEVDLAIQRGRISVFRLHESGECSDPVPIIEKPYHLSYPFLFEWQGKLFLVPESAENHTIDAYQCMRFPDKWQYLCSLMENVDACDATLFPHEDKWWLFCTMRAHENSSICDELCLFYADHPLSDSWTSHDRNPVISDIRSARPAGRIFERDGKIYRPSQNSSYRYGYGLKINEILELTTSTYRERVVEEFQPTWDRSIKAVHSYSRMSGLTVIDAIARIPK